MTYPTCLSSFVYLLVSGSSTSPSGPYSSNQMVWHSLQSMSVNPSARNEWAQMNTDDMDYRPFPASDIEGNKGFYSFQKSCPDYSSAS